MALVDRFFKKKFLQDWKRSKTSNINICCSLDVNNDFQDVKSFSVEFSEWGHSNDKLVVIWNSYEMCP